MKERQGEDMHYCTRLHRYTNWIGNYCLGCHSHHEHP